MISKKVYAQGLALAALFTGGITFLLHSPCRNSNYSDGVFTSFCYSDFAVALAEPGTANFDQLAPIPSLLLQLIAALPFDWLIQLVVLQLLLTALLATAGLLIFRSNLYSPTTAWKFLLLPIWPFVIFVADDFIGAFFMLTSLIAWRKGKYSTAGVSAGLALASGMWTWVLLLGYFVIARRYEALNIFWKVFGTASVTGFALALTRLIQGNSLLVPVDFEAGEGTFSFVWALINRAPLPSNLIFIIGGIAILIAAVQFLDYLPFDFHLEPLLVLLISVSLLFSIAISPQHLVHLVWLLPLWLKDFKLPFVFSIFLTSYVFAVWLRFENGQENARGIPDIPYALIATGMWMTLIWIGYRAYLSISRPGVDANASKI